MKRIIAFILVVSALISLSSMVGCNKSNHIEADNQVTTESPTYKVSYHTLGGSYIPSTDVTSQLDRAPVPFKKGFVFDGWFLNEGFSAPVVFPLKVDTNLTLYAKWLKTNDTSSCQECSIKNWNPYNSNMTYYVTPAGFDYDALQAKGYSHMRITVTYDVNYKKDYDIIGDIGYFGSPKYEIYLLNSDNRGNFEENLETTKDSRTRSISLSSSLVDLKNNRITLKFSTDNVQNIIYFKNIVITYECY